MLQEKKQAFPRMASKTVALIERGHTSGFSSVATRNSQNKVHRDSEVIWGKLSAA
jgi:hypothetical protein